ncbi:MAG: ankyrin repeat domain-containing protein [Sphingobacteriales bacterium]|nr:MAG: ankyrin repeat domain-containing protein [Sphingobacteriales bacterium]
MKLSGIDFSMTDSYDRNNLLIAYSGYGYNERYTPGQLIDFLLNCGIDIDQKRNKRGHEMTALHLAVAKMNVEIVSLLIERGATVDAREVNGNTPLWLAVMNYRGQDRLLSIIELLLANGASLEAKNLHNRSVRDIIDTIGGGIDAGHNKKEWDLRPLFRDWA